jgi:hypothetical protein
MFVVSGADVRGFRCRCFVVSGAVVGLQTNNHTAFRKRNTRAFFNILT